ncbi:retrovirus-related Pol polyprotein from transposon TNT 1-94 [Trichonephila clavipes]|nr:retrovirus-related Pol polyprotein from transposon TNT 1-94 [Trichonephila clavipes]
MKDYIDIDNVNNFTCETCDISKVTRKTHHSIDIYQSSQILELLHADLCGPINIESHGGAKICYANYENLTDKRIKKIRTDNGLEFVNEQLDTYLANSGIFHEKTIPYNSESNGKEERANRVLLERARSSLYESKLPLKFWAEAINCSTQVSNVTPRNGKEKIPLEIWTGNKPKLNYLKKFGCVAYFHVPKVLRNKFEVPGRRGIMLGYARERRGYRIYDIKNQKTTSSPRTGRIEIPVLKLNDVQNQIPVRRSERLKSKLMSVHLVNNVPNSYFEAENSANWKNWKLAMENELDSGDGVCVTLPGYEKLIGDDKVCKLKKSIYGLPQSGRNCSNLCDVLSESESFIKVDTKIFGVMRPGDSLVWESDFRGWDSFCEKNTASVFELLSVIFQTENQISRAEIGAAFLLNALEVPQREPSSVSRECSFVVWVSGELPNLSGSVPLPEEVFKLTLYKLNFRMGHWF